MGVHVLPARMPSKIPTYYVTDTILEDAGNGNIRVWNYELQQGVLVPQYKVIIPAIVAITITRTVNAFANVVVGKGAYRAPGVHIH